ncbi:hypothetical protein SRHO_G00305700 [Serrasalmus rhombeus]
MLYRGPHARDVWGPLRISSWTLALCVLCVRHQLGHQQDMNATQSLTVSHTVQLPCGGAPLEWLIGPPAIHSKDTRPWPLGGHTANAVDRNT